MELKEIISITGKPGLYKVIARSAKGFVVESLDNKKTRFSVNSSQQVAVLDEITIYTEDGENLPLQKVFEKINEFSKENEVPSYNDNPVKIRDFFNKALPEHDKERVYISDMKKVLKWNELIALFEPKEEAGPDKEKESDPKPESKDEQGTKPKETEPKV